MRRKDKEINIYYTPNTGTLPIITLFHEVEEDITDYKTHPNFNDVQMWGKKQNKKTRHFSNTSKWKLHPDFRDIKTWRKKPQHQWNLCHWIFRGSLQRSKHHLCVSQTKWKPHSVSMMDVLAPGMEHSHAPRPLITWQIRDMLSTFSYSPLLDFSFPHIPRWVQELALHLGENRSYIKIYGINQHWHSSSKELSVLT